MNVSGVKQAHHFVAGTVRTVFEHVVALVVEDGLDQLLIYQDFDNGIGGRRRRWKIARNRICVVSLTV